MIPRCPYLLIVFAVVFPMGADTRHVSFSRVGKPGRIGRFAALRRCSVMAKLRRSASVEVTRRRTTVAGIPLAGLAGTGGMLAVLGGSRQRQAIAFEMPGSNNTCSMIEVGGGLQVCDLLKGGGPEPVDDDIVKCNYEVKLADTGKIVVNARNYLFQLGIGEVIQGWETMIIGNESLEGMKVGGVRRAVIPASLAYGNLKRGCNTAGCAIPADSKLELTVELIGIKGATQLSGGASAVPFELSP